MSETPRDPLGDGLSDGRQPDDAFGDLRDRPTPELGSGALWRRIEAQLAPRSASRWRGWLYGVGGQTAPALRLAYGLAAIAGIAWAGWIASTLITAGPEASQFVMLTPAEPTGAPPEPGRDAPVTSTTGSLRLDVRLLRGYDGAPPDDVTAAAGLGVGGADVLYDVRADIEILLPFESYGIVGSWQGSVASGEALDVKLAADYRLVAGSAEISFESSEVLRLNAVELVGVDQDSVAVDLSLEPGRPYILGVLAPGAETPDLILLIRVDRAAQDR